MGRMEREGDRRLCGGSKHVKVQLCPHRAVVSVGSMRRFWPSVPSTDGSQRNCSGSRQLSASSRGTVDLCVNGMPCA